MTFKMDSTQQNFYDALSQHRYDVYLLGGRGGTGKSTVIGLCQDKLLQQGECVIGLYPSHQSRKVGVDSFPGVYNEENISLQTIHSFIGTRILDVNPDEGESVFKQKFQTDITPEIERLVALRNYVDGRQLNVFVDEISMVSKVQMQKLLTILEQSGVYFTLVVLGDYGQLPPVMGKSCDMLLAEYVSDKSYLDEELTTIHRSSLEDIHALCQKVREGHEISEADSGANVLITANRKEFRESLLSHTNLGYDTVALCYTNKKVYGYTKRIAKVLTNDDNPIQKGFHYYCAGSITRACELGMDENDYEGKNEVGLFTGDEVIITDVREPRLIKEPWAGGLSMEVYPVIISPVGNSNLQFETWATIFSAHGGNLNSDAETYLGHMVKLCREAKGVFSNDVTVSSIAEGIKKCSPDLKLALADEYMQMMARRYISQDRPDQAAHRLAKLLWPRIFYIHQNKFLLLRSIHAMTAHASQGSSRSHVHVDATDFKHCPKCMKRKLLYTAVSRAKHSVTILI